MTLLSLTAVGENLSDNVKAYADLVRAEGEYRIAVAQSELLFAQANLTNAQAAHEWQRVRELTLLVNRRALELRRLAKLEYKIQQQAQQLEDRTISLQVIKTGRTSPYVFQALRFIEMRAIPAPLLAEVMSTHIRAYEADHFVPNKPGAEPLDFEGGNLGQLLSFAEKRQFSFAPFSPAHLEVLQGLGKLEQAVIDRTVQLRAQLAELMEKMPRPIEGGENIQAVT